MPKGTEFVDMALDAVGMILERTGVRYGLVMWTPGQPAGDRSVAIITLTEWQDEFKGALEAGARNVENMTTDSGIRQ